MLALFLPTFFLLTTVGCGGPKGDLDVWPRRIDFGEVDFLAEMPEGGYARAEIVLTSRGEAAVTATLAEVDFDHLCVEGFIESMLPADLGALSPDQDYSLFPAVCGYDVEAGERDTLVEGVIAIETDGQDDRIEVDWSFTPVLGIGDDTGW